MVKRQIACWLLKKDTEQISNKANKSKLYDIGYKLLSQYVIDYKYPLHIYLELCRSCNYNCLMCARHKMQDKKGVMPVGMAKMIIDEMAVAGPTSYALHMFGEPLLHPAFSLIVKYIKERNKHNNVILVTNGSLLRKEIADMGVDRIYVSMPSLDEEEYFKITGGDFNKVKQNVIDFVKKNKKYKLLVRYFGKDCPEVWRWKSYGIQFEFKKLHNYAGAQNEWTQLERKPNTYPCYHPFYTLAITYDGDIRICCADWRGQTSLGNIKNTTIKEAWAEGVGNTYELCKSCDIWQYKSNMFFDWQY